MIIKRRFIDIFINLIFNLLKLKRTNKFTCSFAERFDPIYKIKHRDKEYFFSCPNHIGRWRAETYFTEEPETIAWIDTFENNDVFLILEQI